MKLERTILANLISNDEYRRKVIPFIKSEYFIDSNQKMIFDSLNEYFTAYNNAPSKAAMEIKIDGLSTNEQTHKDLLQELGDIYDLPCKETKQWLVDQTEQFCKNKALYNAIFESIEIIDEKSQSKKSKNAIPEILKEALSVSFDSNVGHSYFDDVTKRYEFYHRKEEKYPFDIELLNQITNGGVNAKTLNLVLAPSGGSKSIFLCHIAACYLQQSRDVLYITCEMSEERIAERIDANLLDVNVSDLVNISQKTFETRIDRLKQTCKGKLIIKEYPTATANVMHFRHLLDELRMKNNFVPEIIIVDYLGICTSARFKASSGANSYTIVKAIAEEVRGLAVERNVPIWSAAQLNRAGASNSDPSMSDTAESMGLVHTADLMLSIVSTEDLEQLKQVLFKQLKNRYNDIAINKRFVVGLDKPKMKFFDVEPSAQQGITNSSTINGNSNVITNSPNSAKPSQIKDFGEWD